MSAGPPVEARAVSTAGSALHAVVADQAGSTGRGGALLALSNNPAAPAVAIRGAGVLVDFLNASGISVAQIAQDGTITVRGVELGSGGSSYQPIIRHAYISDGSGSTLPDTSSVWVPVSGFLLPIPAVVGDYVEISAHGGRTNTSSAFLDLAVKTGSSLVRFMANSTSTPAIEGDPGWYFNNGYTNQSGPRGFVVESGDLSGGNVNFVLAAKTSAAAGTVLSTESYPFYWRAINWGPPG